MYESIEHSYFAPRKVAPLNGFDVTHYQGLPDIGIDVENLVASFDSLQPTLTTASIGTPIQFLQSWLPGLVRVMTAARKIDELTGISTAASWEDEEVVLALQELTGKAIPYGDLTNIPLSSWNSAFERRTVVRFEEGLRVGMLEEMRAARMNMDAASAKRASAAMALEMQRNRVGFYGFNSGLNRTYGFLNDPNLPAYVTVATVGGTTLWSGKSFQAILADIRTAIAALRNNSGDQIDPETTQITIALPTSVVDYMGVVSDFGNSVRDWLNKTYSKVRVVSAPELNGANGGQNVMYVYAEQTSADGSSDDGRTFIQVVPTKFKVLGVEKLAKAYLEDYSNATAGVICKRPWAVVRYTGI